jgi:hypothetical protein
MERRERIEVWVEEFTPWGWRPRSALVVDIDVTTSELDTYETPMDPNTMKIRGA